MLYESKKNLLSFKKTLRQKKEYYKISRELDISILKQILIQLCIMDTRRET